MNKFEQQVLIEITKLTMKVNTILSKLEELDNEGNPENVVEETPLNGEVTNTLENNIENTPNT
jgi:hypothetical protein